MSNKIAKLLLEKSGTFLERSEAIKAAVNLGMALNEIEEYLDWLEMVDGDCQDYNKRRESSEDVTRDVG